MNYGPFIIRDVLILFATVGLWMADAALSPEVAQSGRWLPIAAGVGAAICAYNLHEWGHLIGARATESVFKPAKRIYSPFLFSYDSQNNTRKQFLIMSLSGFLATAIFVAVYWAFMPQDRLAGRVGLHGALILAALTVIIEFPIFFRALFGKTLPRVEIFDR